MAIIKISFIKVLYLYIYVMAFDEKSVECFFAGYPAFKRLLIKRKVYSCVSSKLNKSREKRFNCYPSKAWTSLLRKLTTSFPSSHPSKKSSSTPPRYRQSCQYAFTPRKKTDKSGIKTITITIFAQSFTHTHTRTYTLTNTHTYIYTCMYIYT